MPPPEIMIIDPNETLVTALKRIAAFVPKTAADGVDGWEEWNRAGRYVSKIAIEALDKAGIPRQPA